MSGHTARCSRELLGTLAFTMRSFLQGHRSDQMKFIHSCFDPVWKLHRLFRGLLSVLKRISHDKHVEQAYRCEGCMRMTLTNAIVDLIASNQTVELMHSFLIVNECHNPRSEGVGQRL